MKEKRKKKIRKLMAAPFIITVQLRFPFMIIPMQFYDKQVANNVLGLKTSAWKRDFVQNIKN